MIRLIEVEVRRLLARRLVRTLGVVLAVGIVAAPPLVDWAFRERARIERDGDIERCVTGAEPKVRDGVTMPTIPGGIGPPSARQQRCERAVPERDGRFRLPDLGEVLRPLGVLLIVASFGVAASAVGADWQVGFIPTLLTWEGRRERVFLTKLAAVAGIAFAAVALFQGLLTLALVPMVAGRGTDGAAGGWAGEAAWLGLRIAVVAAGAAALGHALAMIGRSTAAAVGGGLAYLLVVESVVSSTFKPLRPWLVLGNAVVFVKGQFEGGPAGDVPGRTVSAAALVLSAYLVVALGVAAWTFRHRDVT